MASLSVPRCPSQSPSADGSERLGAMYNLVCSVTGIAGVAVNYTWSDPGITGNRHDRRVLLLRPLTLDVAGQYTCNTTVNSLYLATRMLQISFSLLGFQECSQ